ncbi:energy transducer TonB [Candidatus Fermentibacteria bacterium]|nr:energy transducer TonB [Candidatus Fermentibacteria bacterium]
MRSREEAWDYKDVGVLVALSVFLVVLETAPDATWEALAVRTSGDELVGVDAPLAYDIPVIEPPETPPVDIDRVLDNAVPDFVPNVVLNLDGNAAGLDTVRTVDLNTDISDPDGSVEGGIPSPGTFIPHSVPPRCTFRPAPEYPEMARLAGIEGRVTLQLWITVDGVPAEVVVMQSSGVESMDSAAVESARATRWAPAESEGGMPVAVWTAVIYDFTLEQR